MNNEFGKAAFFKLASIGALVLLPTEGGKYLMQRNGPEDYNPGKLRPPGGHKSKRDADLDKTILRELKEEFALDPEEIEKRIKRVGLEYRKPYWGNAVYLLKDHGLKPGTYQASNSKNEQVTLEECSLDDPDYVGPMPWKLISEEAKKLGDQEGMGDGVDKAARFITEQELLHYATAPVDERTCPSCGQLVDAGGLPEVRMGAVACPDCGADVPQAEKQAAWKCVAVDLDGTLARSYSGAFAPDKIGTPVPVMVERVKRWLREGKEVVILTARATDPKNIPHVKKWLTEAGLPELEITAVKSPKIQRLYDDRAKGVHRDTGKLKHHKTAGVWDAWDAWDGGEWDLPKTATELLTWHQRKKLPGGLARRKGTQPSDFPAQTVTKGQQVEAEHTSDKQIQTEIVVDHLTEDPDYYNKLEKMEQKESAVLLPLINATVSQTHGLTETPAPAPSLLKQVLDRVSTKPPELPRPPLAALEHQVRTLLKLPKDTQQGWQQRLQKVKQEVSKVTKAELVREKKQGEPRKAPATGREKEATAAQKEPTTNLVEISSKLVDAPTTGPEAIAAALDKIDLDQVEQTALSDIRSGKKTRRPNAVKLLGYVQGFRRSNLHPRDLVISRVPVIPPPFRPYAVAGDTFVPGDANELYRDLINIKGVHQDLEQKVGPAGAAANRLHVYDAVKALYGFGEPVSPKTRERGVSGFLKKITGSSPKFSFVQSKLLAHDQDFVGRSVIGVDPELHMDQIGVPDEMLWPMYSPYIQRRLVRSGMRLEDAVQAVKDRSPQAGAMLDDELQERPVMYSRAPSWHKFSTLGGWVKRVPGNTIMINPLVTTGMNADFDGDAINVHVPALDASVDDVKHKLMPSRQLWSIKSPDRVMPVLKQEQVLGLWTAQHRPARATHTFPSEGLALAAIRAGKVRLSDEIKIDGTGGRDKTAG